MATTLQVGQRISYTRRGMVHHGEVVEIQPNAPFSDVAYVVRVDEHKGRCDLVLPKAITAQARPENCTCDTPFTEDSLICDPCQRGEMELYDRLHAGLLPTGDAWDEYARNIG